MFWQKFWIILKKFWYVPVILVLVVVLSIFLRKGNFALDILNNMIDGYKREIAELERLSQEKEKQKKELEEKYKLVLQQIEMQYSNNNAQLDEEKKKRVKELVEKYSGDDEMMAAAFANEFGLQLDK